ncbi:MAG TPA: hypothetical protein VK207_09075 [Bacteroidales bacterium]|nr:hypothetical protein [Bacteroidales bacterium]
MKFLPLILSFLFLCTSLPGQDTKEMQELYNGSIWINSLAAVKGDQFLLSKSFMPGTITIMGKTYPVSLRYDIYEDQIQIPAGRFGLLQINKLLVDSFSISDRGKDMKFVPLKKDSIVGTKSFYNVLLEGSVSLYVKYVKKIDKLNTGGENAEFYQVNRILFVKDDEFFQVKRKKDLLQAMNDRKSEVRSFIRNHGLRIKQSQPENLIPVIKYYGSLIR